MPTETEQITRLTDRLRELAVILQTVDEMRRLQKEFFNAGRAKSILAQSKRKELEVDAYLKKLRGEDFIKPLPVAPDFSQGKIF